MKNLKLPANASKACPACGKEWTRGYIVKKPDGKKVYKRALECRNPGCGLGYFIGAEITAAEAKGLELIDREKRKKEVVRMAEKEEEKERAAAPHKSWGETYKRCRECGTTDRPNIGRGLCTKCYSKHRNAGTLSQFPVAERPGYKKKQPGRRAAQVRQARAGDDGDVVEVNVKVRLRDLPAKLQAEIKAEVAAKLTDKVLARLSGR